MKIEVDIDDNTYRAARKVFGEDADIGHILGETLRYLMLEYATHPEEFLRRFSGEATPEEIKKMDDLQRRHARDLLKKSRGR